jgi:hypothetical protein
MKAMVMFDKGKRDPRLITIRRGGTLDDHTHKLIAIWAATCAKHVLHFFQEQHPDDNRPGFAIEQAYAWANDEISMTMARAAAFDAHRAARESTGAAKEAARSAGHAVAVAHMADHELGAAVYAIRAVRAAVEPSLKDIAGMDECNWQREQLPDQIRNLVIDDQRIRNEKCWYLFNC